MQSCHHRRRSRWLPRRTAHPLFAFGIAISDLSLFGLGAFFWALVLGVGVSRLVEPRAWQRLHAVSSEAGAT